MLMDILDYSMDERALESAQVEVGGKTYQVQRAGETNNYGPEVEYGFEVSNHGAEEGTVYAELTEVGHQADPEEAIGQILQGTDLMEETRTTKSTEAESFQNEELNNLNPQN